VVVRHTYCKRIRLLALAIPLLPLAGCQRGAEQQPAASPTGGAEQAVRLVVLQGPGGSTLALAPVFIDGRGPFAFALDTGASYSVIDQELADELNLPSAGPPVEVTGVAATAEAGQVRAGGWRVGVVPLPGDTMVTLDLSEPNRRLKLRGLLGSDVLSRFGAVTVDYAHQRLVLRPRP
jgi:hypothetical protein